jgi:broad specificity phosphatase PhoE
MNASTLLPPARTLLFMRHGATALNVAGLRCGGDIDLAMVELGHQQVAQTAQRLAALPARVGVVIVSDLQRTRQSAEIVARRLGGVDVVVVPAFNERHLGQWNRRPIADTQDDLAAGVTPPGGESSAEFMRRIAAAVDAQVLPRLAQRPLLVASKGVARVLSELSAPAARQAPGNADLVEFDLTPMLAGRALECTA